MRLCYEGDFLKKKKKKFYAIEIKLNRLHNWIVESKFVDDLHYKAVIVRKKLHLFSGSNSVGNSIRP